MALVILLLAALGTSGCKPRTPEDFGSWCTEDTDCGRGEVCAPFADAAICYGKGGISTCTLECTRSAQCPVPEGEEVGSCEDGVCAPVTGCL